MGADNILISYLVASYNHESFIRDCLDSIWDDGVDNFELVIIDDGSKDASARVISEWINTKGQSSKIKFICRPNRGVSATFNELVNLSRGLYLRLVASDDMIVKGSTQAMIAALQKQPEKIAVVGDAFVIDRYREVLASSQIVRLGADRDVYLKDIKKAVISHWAICGPSILFRQGYQDIVGRYDERLVVEDWSMYLRLVAINGILFIPTQVAYYRIHGANSSLTKDITKRVANLTSQILAGEGNRDLFRGKYWVLISAEIRLLYAKRAFLERDYLAIFCSLSAYVGWSILALVWRLLG